MAKGRCLWDIQHWRELLSQSDDILEPSNDTVTLTGGVRGEGQTRGQDEKGNLRLVLQAWYSILTAALRRALKVGDKREVRWSKPS
jgi:hypothetical protein